MKKVAILLSLIVSVQLIAHGQKYDTYFKAFLVTANGDGSCTKEAPCTGSQYWGGFPTKYYDYQSGNQSNEKFWFFHGGGAGQSYDDMVSRITGASGWTYIDSNDFEYRWTYDDDNYAYNAYGTNPGSLLRVPFEIWNTTKGYRLCPLLLDYDDNESFGLVPEDHPGSSGSNDPFTDWIYPRLPANWETAGNTAGDDETGYQEWLTKSIAAGVASGGPATIDANGSYLIGTTGADYNDNTVGPEVMGHNVFFVWNLDDVSDGTFDNLPSGFSLAGMEKGSVLKILTGVAMPDTFSWASPNVIDTLNISQSNITDTLFLNWTHSESPYEPSEYLTYRLHLDGKLFKSIRDTLIILDESPYELYITSDTLLYQDFLDNWPAQFQMLPRKTFTFDLWAWFAGDSIKINDGSHYVYVNRYDYLSIAAEGVPLEFALHENYPNPFNPTTTLRFDLPEVSDITLTIYNMLGQKVRTFNYQNTSAGYHSVKWNATNDYGEQVGAGVYLYQLQAKDFVKTRKMVLLK